MDCPHKKVAIVSAVTLVCGAAAYGLYRYFTKPKGLSEKQCILIIGAPAAGKGTQAEFIKNEFNLQYFYAVIIFSHLSSGDMLRHHVKEETELGRKAKDYMHRGELVPDELIFQMFAHILDKEKKGIMFDGFPRNMEQAKKLDEVLKKYGRKVAAVIYLKVPDEVLIERGTGRRIHPSSGRVYHIKHNPPKKEGIDDITGEALVHRDDDKEETIRKRLAVFHQNNDTILEHYNAHDIIHTIDATGEIPDIRKKIEKILKGVIAKS